MKRRPYFPHYHDFCKMELKGLADLYGAEGIGRFMLLLEELVSSPNMKLPRYGPESMAKMASVMMCDPVEAIEFLKGCKQLGLITIDKRYMSSPLAEEFERDRRRKVEILRTNASKRWPNGRIIRRYIDNTDKTDDAIGDPNRSPICIGVPISKIAISPLIQGQPREVDVQNIDVNPRDDVQKPLFKIGEIIKKQDEAKQEIEPKPAPAKAESAQQSWVAIKAKEILDYWNSLGGLKKYDPAMPPYQKELKHIMCSVSNTKVTGLMEYLKQERIADLKLAIDRFAIYQQFVKNNGGKDAFKFCYWNELPHFRRHVDKFVNKEEYEAAMATLRMALKSRQVFGNPLMDIRSLRDAADFEEKLVQKEQRIRNDLRTHSNPLTKKDLEVELSKTVEMLDAVRKKKDAYLRPQSQT